MDTLELVARLRAAGCVFAEDEGELLQGTATDEQHLRAMVDRRVAGEPLEYVLGWAEFAGLRVEVDPGVFRPRPRTEYLVEHAASLLHGASVKGETDRSVPAKNASVKGETDRSVPAESAPDRSVPAESAPARSVPAESAPARSVPAESASGRSAPLQAALPESAPSSGTGQRVDGVASEGAGRSDRPAVVVVDLCCGTGALGLALATRLSLVELHASDLDPVAVACARRNVERVGGRVYEGDLFTALPDRLRGRVDVLLANVPYVPTSALDLMPAEARLHEPVGTLDGGPDGLDMLRRVAAEARHWLVPDGYLLSEVSVAQAQTAAEVLGSAGLEATVVTSEEYDATVVVGRR